MYYFIPINLEAQFAQFIEQWVTSEQGWTIITGIYKPKGEIKEGDSVVKNYLPNREIIEIPYMIGLGTENTQYLQGFCLEADFNKYPQYKAYLDAYNIKGYENPQEFLENN